MAAAETGSGKTGAFALPVLQLVHEARKLRQAGKNTAGPSGGSSDGSLSAVLLSPSDRDAMFAIAQDGLVCQARQANAWAGARATHGVFSGRAYYECWVRDEGLCRVGWSTRAASYDLGTDKQSFGFGGTGKKSHGRQFDDYGESYGLNDVIGCYLDTEAGTIAFSKNGRALGTAFTLPPPLKGQVLYPAVCLKNAEMGFNFGGEPFKHPPPQGFVSVSSLDSKVSAENQVAASAKSSGDARSPLALILEPTRDLAEQTHDCVVQFATHLAGPKLAAELLVGGLDAGAQAKGLKAGCDVVTGTPGRIWDFIESGKLSLDSVQFFVLDEADRLLDTGNQDAILKMHARLNKGAGVARLQTLMFSATLHAPEIRALSERICRAPIWVDLKGKDSVPDTVDHVLVSVDPREDASWLQTQPKTYWDNVHKPNELGPNLTTRDNYSGAAKRLKQRVLQRLIDTHKMEQCMIFCRTNFDCDNLESFLNELGGGKGFRGKAESGKENPYSCVVLGGQRSQDERRSNLQAFKEGDVRFLVCTDVAARGLDIQGLPYVINMTLPDRSEDYVHRVGRVGRADCIGLAISLVSAVPEKVWYCSVKGYKPWLDPKPQDLKTNEEGGHTIWYDEPSLLKDIEKRLGRPIPTMAPDLSLPEEIAAKMQGPGRYGQERGGGVSRDVQERVEALRGKVEELSRLEVEAQHSFFGLKARFGNKRAKVDI